MSARERLHIALLHRATPNSGRSSAYDEPERQITVLGRRRKSPSPDTRVRHDGRNEGSNARKKASSSRNSILESASLLEHSLVVDNAFADRGRKQKSKLAIATQSRMAVENAGPSTSNHYHRLPQALGRRDRDRSQSRDGLSYARKATHTHMEAVVSVSGKRDLHSERAVADSAGEMQRLQEKIDHLKKCLHDSKKVVKKQQKTIESLDKQLEVKSIACDDKDDELHKLKLKLSKNEELISAIEVNMQCQICMDLLNRPYALPPCGHILCMLCLQEWFRQAPVDEDEVYDDDSDYLMNRRKTCPCCRTVVRSRPIPVFLVKTIANSLIKAKPQLRILSSQLGRTSPTLEDDPWEHLFPHVDDFDDTYDEDDRSGDDDGYDRESGTDYSSGSEEEPPFVPAQWEPPDLHIRPEDRLNVDPHELSMLRRGATKEMISRFRMEYTHSGGLVATVSGPGDKRSFISLGWNITLNPDDVTGQEYINRILNDIVVRPERWLINELTARKQEVTALIPAKDVLEYSTTDTEAWTDDDQDDLD